MLYCLLNFFFCLDSTVILPIMLRVEYCLHRFFCLESTVILPSMLPVEYCLHRIFCLESTVILPNMPSVQYCLHRFFFCLFSIVNQPREIKYTYVPDVHERHFFSYCSFLFNPKSANHNFSRQYFYFIFTYHFSEKIKLHISCDSYEMPSLIFSEK